MVSPPPSRCARVSRQGTGASRCVMENTLPVYGPPVAKYDLYMCRRRRHDFSAVFVSFLVCRCRLRREGRILSVCAERTRSVSTSCSRAPQEPVGWVGHRRPCVPTRRDFDPIQIPRCIARTAPFLPRVVSDFQGIASCPDPGEVVRDDHGAWGVFWGVPLELR